MVMCVHSPLGNELGNFPNMIAPPEPSLHWVLFDFEMLGRYVGVPFVLLYLGILAGFSKHEPTNALWTLLGVLHHSEHIWTKAVNQAIAHSRTQHHQATADHLGISQDLLQVMVPVQIILKEQEGGFAEGAGGGSKQTVLKLVRHLAQLQEVHQVSCYHVTNALPLSQLSTSRKKIF